MIEPDLPVSRLFQHLARHGHLAVTLGNIRQGVFGDQRLVLLHPRHMGITEKRDAIRIERDDLVHRLLQGLAGLERQAIKNVAIDRMNAPRPHRIDNGFRLFERLDSVDGFCTLSSKS